MIYNRNITKRKIIQVLSESYAYKGTEKKGDMINLVYDNDGKDAVPVSFSKKFLDTNHENIAKILKLVDEVLDFMNTDKSKDGEDDSGSSGGFGF